MICRPPHIQYNSVQTPSDSLRAIAIFDVGVYSVGVAVIIVSFQCLCGAYLLFVAVVYVVLCPVFTVLLMYVVVCGWWHKNFLLGDY